MTYEKAYAANMNSMNASEAREKLYRLLDETAAAHEPVLITGPRSNGVLVGEEDWNAIQETLYLLSVPGMRESVREGLATPVEECEKEPAGEAVAGCLYQAGAKGCSPACILRSPPLRPNSFSRCLPLIPSRSHRPSRSFLVI